MHEYIYGMRYIPCEWIDQNDDLDFFDEQEDMTATAESSQPPPSLAIASEPPISSTSPTSTTGQSTSTSDQAICNSSKRKGNIIFAIVLYLICKWYQGQKRKSRTNNELLSELVAMERRADEHEEKMFKMYCEMEDRRREMERKHEMEMQQMMMSFVERIMTPSYPPYYAESYGDSSYPPQ